MGFVGETHPGHAHGVLHDDVEIHLHGHGLLPGITGEALARFDISLLQGPHPVHLPPPILGEVFHGLVGFLQRADGRAFGIMDAVLGQRREGRGLEIQGEDWRRG